MATARSARKLFDPDPRLVQAKESSLEQLFDSVINPGLANNFTVVDGQHVIVQLKSNVTEVTTLTPNHVFYYTAPDKRRLRHLLWAAQTNATERNQTLSLTFRQSQSITSSFGFLRSIPLESVIMILYLYFTISKSGLFGGSPAKLYDAKNQVGKQVKWEMVAGVDEAKQEIRELGEYLKNPSEIKRFGVKIPRGAILTGPPGTGKTLLAKALAAEAGVPLLYTAGAEFTSMFMGSSAERVRSLFKNARSKGERGVVLSLPSHL